MADKTCRSCGKHFTVKNYRRNTAIFCSVRCINVGRVSYNKGKTGLQGANRSSFKKGLTVWNKNLKGIHLSPGSEFKKDMVPTRIAGEIIKTCLHCKKEFVVKTYLNRVRCCSRTCARLMEQQGEKHWNWKGGRGTERHRLMSHKDYQIWRVAVFTRDGYACQKCGKKGVYLEADHIKPWAKYPELRFAIDNGRTLCKICHQKTDTYPQSFLGRRAN